MDQEVYNYDDEIKEIKQIDFDVLGNDEVKKRSVLSKESHGIDIPDLYDNMEPKQGGLIDSRLGTTNNNIDCATCGLDTTNCVGHFGHITLAEPVFHVGYLSYLKKILSCICLRCSKLLIHKNEEDIAHMLKHKSGKARLNELRNAIKNVTHCAKPIGCGTPISKIKIDTKKSTHTLVLYAETIAPEMGDDNVTSKKKNIYTLTPEVCHGILSRISDTECMILGMDPKRSRPEMLIYEIFPVPPVHIRPSVRADPTTSIAMEDDLTAKLADIVKCNNRIMKYKETLNENNEKYSQDHLCLLQYHVATFYDNETLTLPKSEQKGKVITALSTRLKGKTGRIRGTLEGKRGDFSGRTVITPDPYLDINELAIPLDIAMNLTKPITVTKINIQELQQYVNNGRYKYPGANCYYPSVLGNIRGVSRQFDLRFKRDNIELKLGDIVERHLIDGDYVLFNRQPTLHKQSMMAHKVRVLKDPTLRTFRFNPCVCTPYNAD